MATSLPCKALHGLRHALRDRNARLLREPAGYPSVTVPNGYVLGMPVGILFFGRAWSEPTLLRLAYAYEQASQHRRAPRLAPTLDLRNAVL